MTCRELLPGARPSRRAVLRWLFLAMGAVAPGVLLPVVTAAHARLVRAAPADGASLPTAPAELALCFSELLERQFHALELESEARPPGTPSRAPLPLTPVVDSRDGTCLTVRLPSLAPGPYIVRWRVVSRDGHATRGAVRFRIG